MSINTVPRIAAATALTGAEVAAQPPETPGGALGAATHRPAELQTCGATQSFSDAQLVPQAPAAQT
jgi:hypothetical protein